MSKLVRYLLIAILLGALTGHVFGPRVAFLGEAGNLTIRVLKYLAMPLLFFGIVETFLKTKIEARDGARLIFFSFTNACAALFISLVIAHTFPVEWALNLKALRANLPTVATNGAPGTPQTLFSTKLFDSVIPVIFIAIISGLILRAFPPRAESSLPLLISRAFLLVQRLLSLVVHLIPLAVFCVMAKIVGASGLTLLPTLGVFVGIVFLGMLIQVGVYYSGLLKFAGFSPREFFRDGATPLLTAFSTGSSLATLPVTLETLQEKRGIEPKYARLAAAIGTNLNHDGILLYEAVAAFFIARLYAIPLTLPQQIKIAFTSVVAAVGIAGVPEAGFITLSLVLTAAGLPLEAAALLLPVDWLIGRMRATTNVASDMTVAHLLSRAGRVR